MRPKYHLVNHRRFHSPPNCGQQAGARHLATEHRARELVKLFHVTSMWAHAAMRLTNEADFWQASCHLV